MIGAFALTEPHAGSDAAALRTRAVRTGNGYTLNGVKQFITSGRIAGAVITFAVTDARAGKRGMSAFLVPGGQRRACASARSSTSWASRPRTRRSSRTKTCTVDADLRIGDEGEGYRIALANLETGRIGIAAQSVGMAQAAAGLRARLRARAAVVRQAARRTPGGAVPARDDGDETRSGPRHWC